MRLPIYCRSTRIVSRATICQCLGHVSLLGFTCATVMLVPLIVLAEEDCDTECDETSMTLGVGGTYGPEFEGGDEYEIGVVPLIKVENFYSFNLEFDELTYDLVQLGSKSQGQLFIAGPLAQLADNRDEDDSDALDGLGDVDFGVDVGLFGELLYGPVKFDLTATQEVADGHGGVLVAFGAGVPLPVSERLVLAPGISTTWADSDYMTSFFGVDAGQAEASGLDEFDADAGFKDISLELGAFFKVTNQLALQSEAGYSRLLGDAADSPIVSGANGSPNQFEAFLGIAYELSF